jgi:hypothetical protein
MNNGIPNQDGLPLGTSFLDALCAIIAMALGVINTTCSKAINKNSPAAFRRNPKVL